MGSLYPLWIIIASFFYLYRKMEDYVNKNFHIEPKNPSVEALERWRKLCTILKNPRRRFRYTANVNKRLEAEAMRRANLNKRLEAEAMRRTNLGKGSVFEKYKPPEEVRRAGFGIDADVLSSLVSSRDCNGLKELCGVEGIARCLDASLDGINSFQQTPLHVRQKVFGSNVYDNRPCKSLWTFTWNGLHDIALIIHMVCVIVYMVIGTAIEGQPEGVCYWLGYILYMILVVMTVATCDYRQYLQFQGLVEEKKKTSICVMRDGEKRSLSIYDLVVGDVIFLFLGDQVPADGIFISGYDLWIDESSLRDTSEPVNVHEENPFLLSGAKVQTGSGKMLVTSVGMRTYWGRLMATLSQRRENEIPLQVKLDGTATVTAKLVLAVSLLTFLVLTADLVAGKALYEFMEWSRSDALNLLKYISIAVTVIVVGVPIGVPLAVRLILAFAERELMDKKAFLQHLFSCETIGSVGSICIDKTRIMTAHHMVVDRLWICNELMSSKDAVAFLKSAKYKHVLDIFLQSIFHNYGSQVVQRNDGTKRNFGSPSELALLEFALDLGGNYGDTCQEIEKLDERPSSSHSKGRSVLVRCHEGRICAFCVGTVDIILHGCNQIVGGDGEYVHLSEEQRKNILNINNIFSHGALKTLCFAFKDVADSGDHRIPDDGYTLIAVAGISDPLRPEAKIALQTLLTAGINLLLVTGDDINSAKAVAKECGMWTDDGLAIEGPEFRSKTPKEMEALIPKLQVLARASPYDKHTLVTKLKSTSGQFVAMIGDASDAPSLHAADVGLAMGIAGTKVAKENADVIILDDNFTTIVNVAKWGRAVYINIQKFVQLQLTVNVVAVMINFASACISGSAPLTAVQLLWVNLVMGTLGALALATEPPNGLMNRPPVGREVSFITKTMWRNIIGQSIYQLAVLGVLNFYGKYLLGLEGSDAADVLNTSIFNTFVFCQVFNVINSRDIEKINVFCGMFRSWIFTALVVSMVTLQVIIVEFGGIYVGSGLVSWQLWLLSILIGLMSLLVAVVLKCIPVKNGLLSTMMVMSHSPVGEILLQSNQAQFYLEDSSGGFSLTSIQ